MKLRKLVTRRRRGGGWLLRARQLAAAFAQAKEQFFPVLSYRTGAYAPNGVPWANG